MKKFALALAAFTMLTATSAMAMDSATLLAHPDRYRVIHADDEEIFYADMESLSGMQTMDFPGSIEKCRLHPLRGKPEKEPQRL